jgi:hypothetical protein
MTENESSQVGALEELRDELTRAITNRESAIDRRSRAWRKRLAPAFLAIMVLGVVAVAVVLGSGSVQPSAAQELERVAEIAGRGVSPPRLQPGEYWYTRSVSTTPLPEALPGTRQHYIELMQRVVTETWTALAGLARMHDIPLGRPMFLTERDRQLWLAAGSPVMESYVGAANTIIRGRPGFPPGLYLFSYAQLQRLPTDPAALLARIREVFVAAERKRAPRLGRLTLAEQSVGEFNTIEGLLLSPTTAHVRAALYRAAALIPRVRYIGAITAPIGRHGVAIELDTPDQLGSGSEHWRVVYDPNTGALLAQLTDFGGPPHPGIYQSESFIASGIVRSVHAIPASLKPVGPATPLKERLHPR